MQGADLVVLCVPVGAMEAVTQEIVPNLAPGATVSDVGSVKREVIAAELVETLERHLRKGQMS